jgi:hypothetical protein
MRLTRERYFNRAYVGAALWVIIFIHRPKLICADTDAFDLDIGEESVPNHFSDVDGSAYGSAARFDADFSCASVEVGDASEDVVHDGLFAN